MPDVTFVVKARPAAVGVSAHGRRRVLVRIPMLKVEATAEPVCPRGGVRFGANSVQLLDGTEPFDDVPAAPSVTFTMGGHRRPADTEGRDGDERVVTLTMSLNEIKVRVEVVVERRFNTAPAARRARLPRPCSNDDHMQADTVDRRLEARRRQMAGACTTAAGDDPDGRGPVRRSRVPA
jgi:hypothetical protein